MILTIHLLALHVHHYNMDKFGVVESNQKDNEELIIDCYTWFGHNRKRLHINARCGSDGVSYDGKLCVKLKHRFDNVYMVLCACY